MCPDNPVPGLSKALTEQDLRKSQNIYNTLQDESRQPELSESHLNALAELFVRHFAHETFGVHLAHSHFRIPSNNVLLGTNYNGPCSRWAKTIPFEDMNLGRVHGHIFVLRDNTFHPYEFQIGSMPDPPQGTSEFLAELAEYLVMHNLTDLVGLQVIHPDPLPMYELVLPMGTIMMDASRLTGCLPTRHTGWRFEIRDGEPRVCTPYETHAKHSGGHDIFNKGSPLPKLDNIEDVMNVLEQKKVLLKV
ncbi:hypothetical protein X797_011327 [Metarhizium robertsii]|uniref:Uncharacterized protein n=1 Tax=Metarhizium robertsii TaxID=568076 RepID=A0A014P2N0_9HYPO|nr:hypothetical protein X797_011327 [Metarhizium robertsii]